jgi:putative colanic acid biosynthesis acetyltransferase WcaF
MRSAEEYKYANTLPIPEKLKRLAWEIIWLIAFRSTPRWTLHWWRRMLLRMFGARIGRGCRIAPTCKVWAPWKLHMGEFSALGDNVDCYSMDRILIGSKVAISQRTFLCSGSHDITSLRRPLITAPIVIHDHAWVAAECFVHPGVTIGEGAVVGARSVVLKDLPPWTVNAGNPCRSIKSRQTTD